jgi:hypothetical protein
LRILTFAAGAVEAVVEAGAGAAVVEEAGAEVAGLAGALDVAGTVVEGVDEEQAVNINESIRMGTRIINHFFIVFSSLKIFLFRFR